jgi:ACS family glucarate transporter-like MFS transporter
MAKNILYFDLETQKSADEVGGWGKISRMGMSVGIKAIQSEFGLTNLEIGWVLSAFIMGYGIVQLPVGMLTDRIGPHRLLAITLFLWSVFHGLTALAEHLAWPPYWTLVEALAAVRFVMGVAQATVLPCAIKTISRWIPADERASANSVVMMGLGIGGSITSPVMAVLMLQYGWQFPFLLAAVAGMVLAAFWGWFGRDTPEAYPHLSRQELERIREGAKPSGPLRRLPTPWRALLRSRSTWCLALSYGISGYPSYVFFTWFFLYLVNARQVDIRAGGYWSALPYVAIAILMPIAGRLGDVLTARWGKRRGRVSVVLMGTLTAATLITLLQFDVPFEGESPTCVTVT